MLGVQDPGQPGSTSELEAVSDGSGYVGREALQYLYSWKQV